MKPIDDFDSWYREALGPDLDALEAQRQAIVKKLTAGASAVGAIVIGVAFLLKWPSVAVLGAIAGAGFGAWWYGRQGGELRLAYKEMVIRKLLGRIDPKLRYEPAGALQESSIQASRLFPDNYTSYTGEDLVYGEVHGTDFGVCEVQLVRKKTQKRQSDGAYRTEVTTIFHGFFFEIGLTHPAEARVVVVPQSQAIKVFGFKLPDFGDWGKDPVVTLDDPAFERRFKVHCRSREAALEALQPELRQHLLRLSGKKHRPIMLSMVDDKAYLAMPHVENMFEPLVSQSLHNPAQLKGYMAALKLIASLPARLSLTRDGGVV